MRNGQVALEKYVITKTLTKPPEAYPDAKNQPHVLVSDKQFITIVNEMANHIYMVYSGFCINNCISFFECYFLGGTEIEAKWLHHWLLCW